MSSPLQIFNYLCGAGMIAGIQGIEGDIGKGGFHTEQPTQEDDAVFVGNQSNGVYDLRGGGVTKPAGEHRPCFPVSHPPESAGRRDP